MNVKIPSAACALLMVLGPLACELDNTARKGGSPDADTKRSKTVEVLTFAKLKGEAFNFDADIPDLLAATDGVLYTATSTTKHLHAFKVDKGNQANAWELLDDFQGAHATANFDLNTGVRTINKLAPVKGGVAVAVSDDTSVPAMTANAGFGLATFWGQRKKAESSVSLLPAAAGSQEFSVVDLVEVTNVKQERIVYAIGHKVAGGFRYNNVLWSNAHALTLDAENGVGGPGVGLKFPGPPIADFTGVNNEIFALAPLPDGRVALGKPDGLLTIANDSVGKKSADTPLFEQKAGADVLDAGHKDQFKAVSGLAPTRVGAMALVGGKYLVIGFVDDRSGNSGILSADVTKPTFAFSTNFAAPSAKVKRIVVDHDEARVILENAIFRFKEGAFTLELESDTLASNRARVNTGVASDPNRPNTDTLTYDTFKGGNAGDVPENGTTFFDAAPHAGSWFYATDKGIYQVKSRKETMSFSVPK